MFLLVRRLCRISIQRIEQKQSLFDRFVRGIANCFSIRLDRQRQCETLGSMFGLNERCRLEANDVMYGPLGCVRFGIRNSSSSFLAVTIAASSGYHRITTWFPRNTMKEKHGWTGKAPQLEDTFQSIQRLQCFSLVGLLQSSWLLRMGQAMGWNCRHGF